MFQGMQASCMCCQTIRMKNGAEHTQSRQRIRDNQRPNVSALFKNWLQTIAIGVVCAPCALAAKVAPGLRRCKDSCAGAWLIASSCCDYFLRPVGMGYVGAGPRSPEGSAATVLLTKGPRKMPLGLAANVWNNCEQQHMSISNMTLKLSKAM